MKKTKIIENVQFENSEMAQAYRATAATKIQRTKIGLIIAAVATVLSIIGMAVGSGSVGGFCLFFAFLGSIASYIVGGGFSIALKAAKKLAVFGWFIAPFPADIATFFITFILSVLAFFFIPVVFVFIHYVQEKRTLASANAYLNAVYAAGSAA